MGVRAVLAVSLGLAAPVWSGCSVVQPVQDEATRHLLEPVIVPAEATGREPRVAVARPRLPLYLDRSQLVTRGADGGIRTHDRRLWAEPLDVNMSRVLASNLRRLTRSRNVQTVDAFVTADYSVLLEVRVHQFDPDPSGALVLECDWRLQPVVGGDVDPIPFRTEVAVSGADDSQSGRVAAMNEALGRLAREVARSL